MTAQEFLIEKKLFRKDRCIEEGKFLSFPINHTRDAHIKTAEDIREAMIEFAKYHVEKFKKEINDKAYYMCKDDELSWHVETKSICNLYPLENIK